MMQTSEIYSQCVPDIQQQVSYIHQRAQQASYPQQKPRQATFIYQISILSQQPNYTVHTSQASTTSRVPTQTADFSEVEEITDSDENDDRLPWQEIRGSGRK
jgi:hypothetical protein